MESTLSLTFDELCREVAIFLGYDPDTATDDDRIISACKSGLRQFYNPPPLDIAPSGYDWSFLKPYTSITLLADAQSVALPDDFGGFEGEIVVVSDSGLNCPVKLYNEGLIRQAYATYPDASGAPRMAALQHLRGTTGQQGQRANLYVHPAADQDYTLEFPYYILPDALTNNRPYPYGGGAHAETILASCKWAAERDLDDQQNGPQRANYLERLRASIILDRRNKPQVLGYNGDASQARWWRRRRRMDQSITFDGITPED